MYLIEILHQTTTFIADDWPILSCILSKFYIKPQPYPAPLFRAHRCILSKFYIKPQQEQWSNSYQNVVSYRNSTSNHNGFGIRHVRRPVVSYRNSTSNHNPNFSIEFFDKLYLIEILHQTTTSRCTSTLRSCCILSKFYIKPQLGYHHSQFRSCCILSKFYIKPQPKYTEHWAFHSCILSKFYIKPQPAIANISAAAGCILSKFYIKPQLHRLGAREATVVSYRNSTSNHNYPRNICLGVGVVSYRNSTSNHNMYLSGLQCGFVVSYRNSTSNHNKRGQFSADLLLYLIEILHQTTTGALTRHPKLGCILSKFYIKPQHPSRFGYSRSVVSYRNSTSNHNSR